MSEYNNDDDAPDDEPEEDEPETEEERPRAVATLPRGAGTKTAKQVAAEEAKKKPKTVLPIGQVETPETMHGTVGITRGVALSNKNDIVYYKVEMPYVRQPGWSQEECAIEASATMNTVTAVVCEHAGLPCELGEDGILREIVRAHFPDATREREDDDRPRRSRDEHPSRNGRGDKYPHPADLECPDTVDPDDWDDLVENYDDYYDNRADKAKGVGNPRGPDFRHKRTKEGIWLKAYSPDGDAKRSGSRHQGSRR